MKYLDLGEDPSTRTATYETMGAKTTAHAAYYIPYREKYLKGSKSPPSAFPCRNGPDETTRTVPSL